MTAPLMTSDNLGYACDGDVRHMAQLLRSMDGMIVRLPLRKKMLGKLLKKTGQQLNADTNRLGNKTASTRTLSFDAFREQLDESELECITILLLFVKDGKPLRVSIEHFQNAAASETHPLALQPEPASVAAKFDTLFGSKSDAISGYEFIVGVDGGVNRYRAKKKAPDHRKLMLKDAALRMIQESDEGDDDSWEDDYSNSSSVKELGRKVGSMSLLDDSDGKK